MKKVFTLLLALVLGWSVKAQCPLQTAVDFTATDVHGETIHLFDILDGGQYVLVDFFFTTCSACIQTIPYMVQSYSMLGCNLHDVFYVEVDTGDSESACLNWVNNHGVEYPTIAGHSGGTTICNQYGISSYPTIILIAPDRSIVIQDLWPISNAQTVITRLGNYGIEQHDCDEPLLDPQVTISIDLVTETEVTVTFTPNEDCATYYYTIATENEVAQWMSETGLDLPHTIQGYGLPAEDILSQTFMGLTPETEYIVYAVPADAEGNLYEVAQETVITTTGGGEIITDFTGTDIKGNEIHLYDILDAGQAVFINFFLTGDPYSETPMSAIVEAFHQYGCNDRDVFFMGISPNGHDDACQAWVEQFGLQYPIISRDGGGNTIAQAIPVALYPALMLIRPDHTIAVRDIYPPTYDYVAQAFNAEGFEQFYCETSVDENETSTTLYPNPANDFVTWKGENLGTVQVYNALGQMIGEFDANVTDLNINKSSYKDGIYVVIAGVKITRFLVRH